MRAIAARFSDAAEIWQEDCGQYPQTAAVDGFIGFLLRIKCTVCILFDWQGDSHKFDMVPVWIGPLFVYGYEASWSEIGVGWSWRNWYFARYGNGI